MHRTTILLPEDLRRAAEREAKRAGLSLGELIRQRLRPALEGQKSRVPAFFSRTPWKGHGPADLSANHDQYLYGS
jgi:hypothetical protein